MPLLLDIDLYRFIVISCYIPRPPVVPSEKVFGVGLEGPVIPSEEVLGGVGYTGYRYIPLGNGPTNMGQNRWQATIHVDHLIKRIVVLGWAAALGTTRTVKLQDHSEILKPPTWWLL